MWYLIAGGAALYALFMLMIMALMKAASDADDQLDDYFASSRDEWDGE